MKNPKLHVPHCMYFNVFQLPSGEWPQGSLFDFFHANPIFCQIVSRKRTGFEIVPDHLIN